MVLSTLTVGPFLDAHLQKCKRKGKVTVENRILPMILGSTIIPAGMLAFGWSVQYKVHWTVPILFSALVGYGYVSVAISAWSYLVDAFDIYAASATAGNVILRNAGAAALPLSGPTLAGKVGYGWAYSALALIGTVAVPISLVLLHMGARLRKVPARD